MSNTGFDTDMLTVEELAQAGHSELGACRSARWEYVEHRCCFCNRVVKEPITKYKVGGFDFVPEGKTAHKGCAQRQVDALIKHLGLDKKQ